MHPFAIDIEAPSVTPPVDREKIDQRVERSRRELLNWVLSTTHDRVDPTVLRMQPALERLRLIHPVAAQVVEYRYFGRVGIRIIAACMQSTQEQCRRDLRFGRAWILKSLKADGR